MNTLREQIEILSRSNFDDTEAQRLGYASMEKFEEMHCAELPDEYWERLACALGYESYQALADEVDAAQAAEWEAEARAKGFASLDAYIEAQRQESLTNDAEA